MYVAECSNDQIQGTKSLNAVVIKQWVEVTNE